MDLRHHHPHACIRRSRANAFLVATVLTLGIAVAIRGERVSASDNLSVGAESPSLAPQRPYTDTTQLFLPLVLYDWPPVPGVPALQVIDNADWDNHYAVSWTASVRADSYILQEASNASFSDAVVVFQGSQLSHWVSGKHPGTYYYRVQAVNAWGTSTWSAAQTVTIYPLFVGLNLRWDGMGYLRGSSDFYADIGWHLTRQLDVLTDPTTVRSSAHEWYSPNPNGWTDDYWSAFYSVPTGHWLSSSVPGDPSWKWGYDWFLPYNLQLSSGMTLYVDGQPFSVAGPISGYTAFGHAVQYWQLVNQATFVIHDDGSGWVQKVHPGEATLRYDAGSTRLLLYDNVFRRYYYQGQLTQFTIQYIANLTSTNAFSISSVVQGTTEAPLALPSLDARVEVHPSPPPAGLLHSDGP